jgi:hypothetical protein
MARRIQNLISPVEAKDENSCSGHPGFTLIRRPPICQLHSGFHSGSTSIATGNSARTVAPTVILTA